MSNNAFNLGNLVNHNELFNMLKINYEKINSIINSPIPYKFNDLEQLSIKFLNGNFSIDEDITKVIIIKLHNIIFSSSINDLNTKRIMNDLFELNLFHDDKYSLKDYIIKNNKKSVVDNDHNIFTLLKTIILCKMHEKINIQRNNNNTNKIDINEKLNKNLQFFIGEIHIPNGMRNKFKGYNFFNDEFLKKYNIPQNIINSMNIILDHFIFSVNKATNNDTKKKIKIKPSNLNTYYILLNIT